MTVDEMIEWLESAKRQNPDRGIGDYEVITDERVGVLDPMVDHGMGTVILSMDSGA